ncbi:MAG: SurA N-terminal domain-containing protein [Vicinamibacteria bacterium]
MSRHATRLTLAAVASLLAACRGAGGRAGAAPTPYPTDEASLSRPLPTPVPEVVAFVNGQPVRVEQVVPLAKKELDGRTAEEIEKRKPLALRRALLRYVDRELLVQEAIARGIVADPRKLDWAYDQLRREYPDEEKWREHLSDQGLTPDRFRTELRQQMTATALVDTELLKVAVRDEEARAVYEANPSAFGAAGPQGPPPYEAVRDRAAALVREGWRQATTDELLATLRARARIEILI